VRTERPKIAISGSYQYAGVLSDLFKIATNVVFSTMMLLGLPPELLIHILSGLSSNDILFSALLVNRYLHDLIRESSLLQYYMETKYAGVEDNPQSTMVVADRLKALRRSEYAWSNFVVGKQNDLPIMHRSGGLYDLTAGVYVLGELGNANPDYPTPALRYTNLYEDQGNNPWTRISVNRNIIDFGLAVREHDLIALVTTYVSLQCM
jgi:hypothetical protein